MKPSFIRQSFYGAIHQLGPSISPICQKISLIFHLMQVACHRLILAASSPYLANLVSSHTNTSLPLTLPISKLQMTFLLDFIYNGEVEVEKEELYKFLNMGERMQLKGLVKPHGQEPAADTKKFDKTGSVNSQKDSPEKHDFDSMIRRDEDKWSCIKCGKVSLFHPDMI